MSADLPTNKVEFLTRLKTFQVNKLIRELLFAATPTFIALIVFLAGASLLVSTAAPGFIARANLARGFIPLPVVELSHFVASVIGVLLILMADGLRQRLEPAWMLSIGLLAIGAAAAILLGAHYWYAAGIVMMLALLVFSKRAFYRPTALQDMQPSRVAAIVVFGAVIAVMWIGLVNFKHVEYQNDLWWSFAFDAHASRFLRSLVTIPVVLGMIMLWRALAPPKAPPPQKLTPDLSARITSILESADAGYSDASLVYLGDKRLLFSDSGDSFLMYGSIGRSWIVIGAPAGRASEFSDLSWKFIDLCDQYRAQPIFYSIRADFLPAVLDLGLAVQKIGESAVIRLAEFSLSGKKRAKLRQAQRRFARDGFSFRILNRDETVVAMNDLEQVSRDWLRNHPGKEKGFTLGKFSASYLAHFSTAVVRNDAGIVAFANLWTTGRRDSFSIDLMRYSAAAPHGVMDFLFTELALWGKEEGYKSFDLGMTPLAGLPNRQKAPLLSKLGSAVFRSGEFFYHFEGLRQYKQKFQPEWEPLYIAAPGSVSLAVGLGQVAMLTSRGTQSRRR